MAQFTIFKFLFALKFNLKVEKSQNKVGVDEEIGWLQK